MPYVYAVTEAHAAERAPHVVRWGELAAIVGAAPSAGRPDERSLWHHEAVVEAAMERGPVLPMRFGSVVEDVTGFLASRHEELAAGLERVRGAVEMGVRVSAGGAGAEPASGTEYLMRRAAVAAAGEQLHAALAELSRASVRLRHAYAYLVDRDAVGSFCERAASLSDRAGAELVCTGPWPPYSFVEPA
jgi:hypothetical protein